jgi:hypothetical protein
LRMPVQIECCANLDIAPPNTPFRGNILHRSRCC